MKKPIALIVLDGFGAAPPSVGNAISQAKKPFFDKLIQTFPMMLLQASGMDVGLPIGEVGNSEVGHITLGSGILRYQSLPRIDKSISTGEFFKLPGMQNIIKHAVNSKCKLHLVGLIGNGGVHSSQEHLEALIAFAKTAKIENLFLHLFLDGRDTTKDLGKLFVEKTLAFLKKEKIGTIASLSGRFYGMDRNKNWDRIEKAYNAIVNGNSKETFSDPIKAVEASYAKNIFDEEFVPAVIMDKNQKPVAIIEDNDVVIFFNFRADRGRQLTQAFVLPDFNKFTTKKFSNLITTTFTEYEAGLPVTHVLFPPEIIANPLASIFSEYNLRQLHVAETEKYAHVTFFMNGMREIPFAGEDHILIPSPNVISYDEKPEMSAAGVTEAVLNSLRSDSHDFYIINYANPDMVGHTGNLKAGIKAVEAVDQCLAKIVPEFTKKGANVFIVGDHGNAEEMINLATGEIDKEHNNYPVPFIMVGNELRDQANNQIIDNDFSTLTPVGILADVAPTILAAAGLAKPSEMTGISLL